MDNNLLIIGGTGSFGQKVARHFSSKGWHITIFSRDERKQHQMQQVCPIFRYVIGDVRDPLSVRRAMRDQTVVFHAAALKQVPSCEKFPEEALRTNCLGVLNAVRAAEESDTVKQFVFLSTDKAVQPINSMGISKAMAERIVCSVDVPGKRFCCVRYGNVLGTRGSILPVWERQLELGLPVTITDPRMTRFVMNLGDSIGLVEQAIADLETDINGTILVKKAPSTTVRTILETYLAVKGKLGWPVFESGARPGEKLNEVLVCQEELRRSAESPEHILVFNHEIGKELRPKGPYESDRHYAFTNRSLQEMINVALKDLEDEL